MQLLCLLLLLISDNDASNTWNRFRGPNGSGISNQQNIPIESKPSILWKIPLSGAGYGSPVIEQNRLFLQSASSDGKTREVLCLDATTGKEIWKKTLDGNSSHTHKKNNLASGTAAVWKDQVSFCVWDGKELSLVAFNTESGSKLWSSKLGSFASQHGAGHSPVYVDGKVIVSFDQDGKAEVVAVDAVTGKLAWKQQRKAFRACYSSPIVRQIDGKTEVIITSTAGLTGYDPATGAIRWNWDWKFARVPLRTVSTPVLSDSGILVASAGDGGGDRHTVAVQIPMKKDAQPKLLWELTRGVPYVPCVLLSKAVVYYIGDNGIAGALDLQTGKTLWTQRISGNVSASPMLIDGHIWSAAEDGQVIIFDADDKKLTKLAQYDLGENIFASPAVANERLYIRTQTQLYCVGKK